MNKVEIYSNWCYYDQLDGKNLKDGEKLKVRWPDGQETQENVILKKTSQTVSDMGHPYDVPIHQAYVAVTVHGAECLVRLTADGILCERI